MAANLFDVFVVGSSDPSAAGETRLAAALATKHGVPLPTVAKAIAAKNLRAGQGLEQAQAQALVKQLQAMGAVTVIRPAVARGTVVQSARSTGTMPVAKMSGVQPVASPPPGPLSGRPPMPSSTGWAAAAAPLPAPTPAPVSLSGTSSFGMPAIGTAIGGDPFAPLAPSSAPAATREGYDPFQPRKVATPVVSTAKVRTPPPPQHVAMPSDSGLALDVEPTPARLELARGNRREAEDDESGPRVRSAMAASSLREMDAGGASGVAMDEDPKNLNLVRCVQHGLYYDKTKASGCRKCMAGARDFATKIEHRDDAFRIVDVRGKPARRAFLGLSFALVLGFLPAAYYCFGPGATEAHRLRLEQEVLSRQTGTEDNLRVFDDLDVQVKTSHERSTRNTAIVWLAVTGVAMLGWYKIT